MAGHLKCRLNKAADPRLASFFNVVSKIIVRAIGCLVTGMFVVTGFPAQAQVKWPETLRGHGGPIRSIILSDDGRQALTGSFDYSIIQWNLEDNKASVVHRLLGHEAAVNDVASVPGHAVAISVGDDGATIFWSLDDASMLGKSSGLPDRVVDVAVSPDGSLAATARWDKTIELFDVKTRKPLTSLQGHGGNVNAVVFSGDGSRLYSADQRGVILEWEINDPATKPPVILRTVYEHGWGINSLALMENNQLLFGAQDGAVAALDLNTGKTAFAMPNRGHPIQQVKVSADGALAGFADGVGKIGVFSPQTGAMIEEGQVTFGPVWDFAFIPKTNLIYHVGLDDFASLWQIAPKKLDQNRSTFPRRFQQTSSADPGEQEFLRKCSICHTITPNDANRAGPTLFGIIGRKAGSVENYAYSKALAQSSIIWNEETISRLFDEGPDVVVPGTKMPIQRLKQVERRNDLIEYLKKATQKQP